MAENSAYWLGSTLGDAASSTGWKGPYSDTDIDNIHSIMLGNDDNQGFVSPGYGNNLRVYANTPAAMNVLVATGAAFVRGKVYENTAINTLTIGANASGSPRIDRIVLQITFATQTIRLFVLAGTPGAAPALPTLTQDATTYEVSLAYVWVANGAATIADTDVHDEREFLLTSSGMNDSYGNDNLLSNSEFMAFGRFTPHAAQAFPPDRWVLSSSPSIAGVTKPSQMSRGQAIQLTASGANEGISQTVLVKASTTYTIKLLTWVTSGDVGSIVVTTNSASPATITRYTRRVGEWLEERVVYTTEADASQLTLTLLCLNTTDVVNYGQALVVEGYYPGPFRPISEVLALDYFIRDQFYGDGLGTYASSADIPGTVSLGSDYYQNVFEGVKGICIEVVFKDAGSAGAGSSINFDVALSIAPNTQIFIQNFIDGIPNNKRRSVNGWIYFNMRYIPGLVRELYFRVFGSGAGIGWEAVIIGLII